MALAGVVEIGLLEDEGHAEHALPEVDRGLAIGADQRDVMQTLRLKLFHGVSPQAFSTSLDLYSLRGRLPAGSELDLGRHQKLVAQARTDALRESLDVGPGRDFDG